MCNRWFMNFKKLFNSYRLFYYEGILGPGHHTVVDWNLNNLVWVKLS